MSKQRRKRGYFITFEGGEGSGKSTQIKWLLSWLSKEVPVVLSSEPGGTEVGKAIRKLLLDPNYKQFSPRTELFLYEADRAQHVDEVILPALAAGKIVVTDRFADSSAVYQGISRKLGLQRVLSLNRFATSGLDPDLTLLLDLPEDVGYQRIQVRKRLDRLEKEHRAFHRQVRLGFLNLAKIFPKRFVVIDATHSKEMIAREIETTVKERLKKKGLWH